MHTWCVVNVIFRETFHFSISDVTRTKVTSSNVELSNLVVIYKLFRGVQQVYGTVIHGFTCCHNFISFSIGEIGSYYILKIFY